MGKTNRLRQFTTFKQRGDQRTIKGIASGYGIYRLHFKAGHPTTFTFAAGPYATAAKGNDHRTDTFIMEHFGGFCRIIVAFHAHAGELFRFGLVRGNDIYQREQLIGQFTCRRRIEDD